MSWSTLTYSFTMRHTTWLKTPSNQLKILNWNSRNSSLLFRNKRRWLFSYSLRKNRNWAKFKSKQHYNASRSSSDKSNYKIMRHRHPTSTSKSWLNSMKSEFRTLKIADTTTSNVSRNRSTNCSNSLSKSVWSLSPNKTKSWRSSN